MRVRHHNAKLGPLRPSDWTGMVLILGNSLFSCVIRSCGPANLDVVESV